MVIFFRGVRNWLIAWPKLTGLFLQISFCRRNLQPIFVNYIADEWNFYELVYPLVTIVHLVYAELGYLRKEHAATAASTLTKSLESTWSPNENGASSFCRCFPTRLCFLWRMGYVSTGSPKLFIFLKSKTFCYKIFSLDGRNGIWHSERSFCYHIQKIGRFLITIANLEH